MRNGKDAMPVRTVDHLERHGDRALKRIEIAAGRAKTAFAVKGNEFECTAGRTAVHSTAKGRIAAVNHAVDILHNDRASLQGILDFLIMVRKNLLQNVHRNILQQKPVFRYPSRLRG